MPLPELPRLTFATAKEWIEWLSRAHAEAPGVWLQFARKGSGIPSVTYAEAVEAALCHGWIDGQVKSLDSEYYLQKFTPRRKGSVWSLINREKALRLIEQGLMRPAGMAAIEAAKQNGRWKAAYASPSKAEVPADLSAALAADPKAAAVFERLTGSDRYAILFRLQTTLKAATRTTIILKLVKELASRADTP